MSAPVEPGEVLAGKFRIERVLGRGGMGVVVAARHLKLDELVAIKFLLPEAVSNRAAVARFEQEARAAVKIKSEHIARVSDVGLLEWGAPYMVMEYLHGRDLGEIVAERGPLPLPEAVDYLLQASEAVAEAHMLGIVHRDLKPANLFLSHRPDGSPCVKVLDFGISKLSSVTGSGSDPGMGMTSTTLVLGSPLYMSPEQLASARDVDTRTDVWALGVILFELLTAHQPFMAATLPQLCVTIVNQPPTPLRNYRPDLPLEVQEVVLSCLEKDRERRLQTVAEFAQRLVEFAPAHARVSLDRITGLSRPFGVARSSSGPPPPTLAAEVRSKTVGEFTSTRRASHSGKRWAVASVLGVAGLATAAYLLLRDRTPPPIATMPPSDAVLPSETKVAAAPVVSPLPLGDGTAAASAAASAPPQGSAVKPGKDARRQVRHDRSSTQRDATSPTPRANNPNISSENQKPDAGRRPPGDWGGRL